MGASAHSHEFCKMVAREILRLAIFFVAHCFGSLGERCVDLCCDFSSFSSPAVGASPDEHADQAYSFA